MRSTLPGLTDTFVPLGDRVKFARLRTARRSPHLNPCRRGTRPQCARVDDLHPSWKRLLTPRLPRCSPEAGNQSDALADLAVDDKSDDVADILIDLVRPRDTQLPGHALAEIARRCDIAGHTGHMVKLDPHRSAQLVVLKAYDFPSVLIELGFLSNKDDESELVSPKWRDTTADSIVTAVDRFFASHAADVAQ